MQRISGFNENLQMLYPGLEDPIAETIYNKEEITKQPSRPVANQQKPLQENKESFVDELQNLSTTLDSTKVIRVVIEIAIKVVQ